MYLEGMCNIYIDLSLVKMELVVLYVYLSLVKMELVML